MALMNSWFFCPVTRKGRNNEARPNLVLGFGLLKRFSLSVTLLVLILLVSLGSRDVEARTEYRDVEWAWCLYDCSYSGDYTTPDAVIDGLNSYVDYQYAQCMGSSATAECGGGCYKVNRSSPTPAGGFAVVNGKSTFQQTAVNKSTQFTPACGGRAASTTVTDLGSAAGAVYGKFFCPQEDGWNMSTDSQKTITVAGVATTSYQASCQKEIPDPPSCKNPKYGNPIDPINKAKIELEQDYAAVDGLLKVRRYYTSAGSGRWAWGDIGSELMDYTGRNVSMPSNVFAFAGTIKTVPPGFYYSGNRPPPQDTPRPFPLIKTQPDSGQKEVWVTLQDGSRAVFTEAAAGIFTTLEPTKPTLSVGSMPDGSASWVFKNPNVGFNIFDNTGRLIREVRLDGKTLTYSLLTNGLTVTSNPGNRFVVYTKSPVSGQIFSVTLPNGQQITYGVDISSRINDVTYSDGKTKKYIYNEAVYTGTTKSVPNRLTGIVDESEIRTSVFTYDGQNPVSTERAGGVEKFSFSYSPDHYTSQSGSSVVSMPITSSTTSLTWSRGSNGERRLVSQSQPAGSGCAASSSQLDYDTQGNVTSRDDFAGKRVCYAHDLSRNLENNRVEGLTAGAACAPLITANATLPANSRKLSTQWHPDWRLESRIAEPGLITTLVYNGQPDPTAGNAIASCAPTSAVLPDGKPVAVLCKKVEQATTDVNGAAGFTAAFQAGVAARIWKWTYNSFGQVLTEDGPRTDVADVTTYTYHAATAFTGTDPYAVGVTLGDLKSITNASGTTQYTKYNKHGQLLESIDPNGVVSSYTYDLRQRLLSATVGGQQTTYAYDPAGQLKKVTRPDTSWTGYDYDAAHRLVAVYNNLGNRIDYTLDNAGNRTAENIKDPGGALKRQLARSIDPLGRVQQTTGRQ